ncbi:ATP-binding protein [Nocardia cyriacigeorgica]
MLTLTGAGGIGKTRLALHTARAKRRAFSDGVWIVELGLLKDPSLLPQVVSAALGVPETSTMSRTDALLDFLADRDTLLILDNCEHLTDACARLVRTLLRGAEGLRILATSRQALGVDGEQVFPVRPLAVPEEGVSYELTSDLLSYESVGLFVDRARSIAPSFQLDRANGEHVARLCRELEGVPLAIELAAIRTRSLSVGEIVARLDDRFRLLSQGHRASDARQTSLMAMVEWSYELLDEPDRVLWARLSIFAGGFDLASAESVCCDEGVSAESLLRRLHSLVERSIVIREDSDNGAGRYRMLETLRQYGAAHLEKSGELDVIRSRHRDRYKALAAQAGAGWSSAQQLEWMRRLKNERHNIRVAIEHSLRTPADAIEGLELVVDARYFWLAHGLSEGRRHAERLLAALPRGAEADAAKVRGQWLAGWLAFYQGDIAVARRYAEDSATLAERLGDDESRAYAAYVSGLAAASDRDYGRAKESWLSAREIHRRTGDLVGGWLATADLAGVLGVLGDVDEATAISDQAVAECADRGAVWSQCYVLWIRADLLRMKNEHAAAARLLRMIAENHRALDDPVFMGAVFESLSWGRSQRDDDARFTAWLLGAAEATWRSAGSSLLQFAEWGQEHERARDRASAALGESAFAEEYRRGMKSTVADAIDRVLGNEAHPPGQRSSHVDDVRMGGLTPREIEIAELISQGLTNKKIAQRLVIAQRTAEGHVERILRKLDCDSRAQVAAWWKERTSAGPLP